MNRYVMAALSLMLTAGAQADRIRPDVEVNVPPEVFSSSGQRAQPCNQCCIYQDQNYSEGAVVKADGVLLQCQRDERTISTNPLVWRRVKRINASSSGISAGAKRITESLFRRTPRQRAVVVRR